MFRAKDIGKLVSMTNASILLFTFFNFYILLEVEENNNSPRILVSSSGQRYRAILVLQWTLNQKEIFLENFQNFLTKKNIVISL